MKFDNLTNEQIEWLEQKIYEAYDEGWTDSDNYKDHLDNSWKESLAKNQTCHILAERFMVPSEFNFDTKDLITHDDYVPVLLEWWYAYLTKGKL